MAENRYSNFGNLTQKQKKLYDISKILNQNDSELDLLFQNYFKKLEKLTVIEAERQAALENLRVLTSQLQTKRLKEKLKSEYKHFTL